MAQRTRAHPSFLLRHLELSRRLGLSAIQMTRIFFQNILVQVLRRTNIQIPLHVHLLVAKRRLQIFIYLLSPRRPEILGWLSLPFLQGLFLDLKVGVNVGTVWLLFFPGFVGSLGRGVCVEGRASFEVVH